MEENPKAKVKNTRKRVTVAVVIIILAAAVILACTDFITDIIWFNEVGYVSVFLTEIVTKIKIGVPVFLVVTVLSVIALTALKNNFLKKNNFDLESDRDKKSVRRVRLVISVALGVFLSVVLIQKLWFQMLEFFNSSSFNITDPLFNNDVGFYMFKYQFLKGDRKSVV